MGEYNMRQEAKGNRFDGNAWFERQVRKRTRDALTARGSRAKVNTIEYQSEYRRQYALFRAERAAVKQRRAEKRALRMEAKG